LVFQANERRRDVGRVGYRAADNGGSGEAVRAALAKGIRETQDGRDQGGQAEHGPKREMTIGQIENLFHFRQNLPHEKTDLNNLSW
jgi:hypothetical protein